MAITLKDLREFAIARNFFAPTTLGRAFQKMGFVQADPIRAPARAQDLILRHRVKHYHAGDLERRYEELDIEEDVFVNYGYVTTSLHQLMHPRANCSQGLPSAQRKKAQLLLEFVRGRGSVHPREVDEHFSHGKTTNYWGGSSNATTHLMDAMHYHGMLRVVRREKGIRLYTAREPAANAFGRSGKIDTRINAAERRARIDSLIDAVARIYAPLPAPSLNFYVRRLRYAVPQWRDQLGGALQRAQARLAHTRIDSVDWYWPAAEDPLVQQRAGKKGLPYSLFPDAVRLLAPFDPLVHDRARFELLWNWMYRFEAYTPATKRKLGYYAMPMLWRDRVIGWANLEVKNFELLSDFGYVGSEPRDRVFKRELAAELDRMRA
ncbi:MAG TPA: crosslink repair DNA glycosylase YcaQ family protein, partial [Pyrinomonadaceae bacterium]